MLHSSSKKNIKTNNETIITNKEDEQLTPSQKYFQDILFKYSNTFSREICDKDIFRAILVDMTKKYDCGWQLVYDTADMLYSHFIGSTIINALNTDTFSEQELRRIIKFGRYIHYITSALEEYLGCLTKENIEPTSEDDYRLFDEVVARMTKDIKDNHSRIWGLTV